MDSFDFRSNIGLGDILRISVLLKFVVIFQLLIALPLGAEESEPVAVSDISSRLSDISYLLNLKIRRFEEVDVDKASLVGPHFTIKGNILLSEKQKFDFSIVFIQEFGSSQSRFGENVPSNGIFINHGFVTYQPKFWQVDAGVINQSWLDNELLFAAQPFPAARVIYYREKEDYQYQIFFQAAMPTSTRIKTRVGENESEPYSIISGVGFSGTKNNWEHSSKLYYYSIDSLPTEVALESARFGNSVNVISPSRALFTKDFAGVSLTTNHKLDFEDFTFLLDFALLNNSKVGDGFSLGQILKIGARYQFYGKEQSFQLVNFFNESDTSVASYNSYRIGHNNREGNGIIIHQRFNENLSADLTYLESKEINADLIQGDINYLEINFNWLF